MDKLDDELWKLFLEYRDKLEDIEYKDKLRGGVQGKIKNFDELKESLTTTIIELLESYGWVHADECYEMVADNPPIMRNEGRD